MTVQIHPSSVVSPEAVLEDGVVVGPFCVIEGNARLAPGARLALLEDVVTTGGSTLKAAAKLRDAGYAVACVVALVDRLEGGRSAIEQDGVPVVALFTRDDFIPPAPR